MGAGHYARLQHFRWYETSSPNPSQKSFQRRFVGLTDNLPAEIRCHPKVTIDKVVVPT